MYEEAQSGSQAQQFGTLVNAQTFEAIRPATEKDWALSGAPAHVERTDPFYSPEIGTEVRIDKALPVAKTGGDDENEDDASAKPAEPAL